MVDNLLLIMTIVRDLSWSIYLGIIVGFSVTSLFPEATFSRIKSFQSFGVILGLSLGATILPSIALLWFERGNFYPSSTIEMVGWIIGLCMWVSNIILEIWTLDPLRKDDLGILPDTIIIVEAEDKAMYHLRFHSVLVVLTHTFCWLSLQ